MGRLCYSTSIKYSEKASVNYQFWQVSEVNNWIIVLVPNKTDFLKKQFQEAKNRNFNHEFAFMYKINYRTGQTHLWLSCTTYFLLNRYRTINDAISLLHRSNQSLRSNKVEGTLQETFLVHQAIFLYCFIKGLVWYSSLQANMIYLRVSRHKKIIWKTNTCFPCRS